MSNLAFNEEGRPDEGVSYGITSVDSATTSCKRHREQFPDSDELFEEQTRFQQIRKEIETVFLAEEERRYKKVWRKSFEKANRREAKMDLEMENQVELQRLSQRLKEEVHTGILAALEREKERVKELEARLEAAEREIGELKAVAAKRLTGGEGEVSKDGGGLEVAVIVIDDEEDEIDGDVDDYEGGDGSEGEEEDEGEDEGEGEED
ncbi:hypothetical protein LZ554_001381 [Drepanopeziza brunnea f. sp. 'monogermtubi']|nr:hypothetical protein LZ554_001381 [Drepanopeziza brunnea f. sp. 'monogermtubi']